MALLSPESRQRTKGFTLAELLVTISLVAIVTAFSTPSFINQLAYHQARESALTTFTALKLCRSQAISYLSDVRCVVNVTGGELVTELWIDITGNNTTQSRLFSRKVGNVSMVDFSQTSLTVNFNELGHVGATDNIVICSRERAYLESNYRLTIGLSGTVDFEEVANSAC